MIRLPMLLLLMTLPLGGSEPIAKPVAPVLVPGIYLCATETPRGTNAESALTLSRNADAWLVRWSNGVIGVGLLRDEELIVGWMTAENPGVSVYRVGAGKLSGTWMTADGVQRSEEWSLLRAAK